MVLGISSVVKRHHVGPQASLSSTPRLPPHLSMLVLHHPQVFPLKFPLVPTLKLPNNVEPQEAFAAIEPSDDLIPQDDFEQFLEFIHHT